MVSPPAPTLNPALRNFWLTPARNRILYGGRSSTKSWDAAGFAIFLAQHCSLRVLCTRQFQNKIEESVYSLLKVQIERFGLSDQFDILKNKISHKVTGTEFMFYGLWRHIDEIKSLESIDIHWAEEAHLLSEEQWKIINPTVRKEGSQHWIIFNPRLVSDFVWRRFVVNPPGPAVTLTADDEPPAGRVETVIRKINYPENPFLSQTMRRIIDQAFEEDEEDARHIYLGEPRSDDERVIIKRSWVTAAIDAHKKLGITPSGQRRIGWDIADDGNDANATVAAYGLLAMSVQQWKGEPDKLMQSASRVWSQARRINADIYYDDIGVGAFAGSKFGELNASSGTRVQYTGFGAGGKLVNPDDEYQPGVTNRDFFANLKAQSWWSVADRFRNTYAAIMHGEQFDDDELISINSGCDHLEQLIDELSTPRRDFDAYGRVKVESKKDLDKREVDSPNLADAFIMAYNPLIAGHVDYSKLL